MKFRWKFAAGSFGGPLSACAIVLALIAATPALAQAPGTVPSSRAADPPTSAVQTVPAQTSPGPAQGRATEAAPPPADETSRPIASAGRLQHELSPWSMFLTADPLVKAVMISLAFASLVTWTIFFAKTVQLAHTRRRLGAALARIAEARTLSEAQLALNAGDSVLSALLRAALQEVRLSGDGASDEGIKERAASRFAEITRAEARAMRQGMAILATIGATAPFVGLFGTVWGIMDSFIGISKAQTTNLAVVAPGIAEALLATAIGLAAAIPAVIIYNHFSRATKGYLEVVSRGSGAVGRLLSRDLDRVRGRVLTRAAE
jgi:biopolymer transport protein ExbB